MTNEFKPGLEGVVAAKTQLSFIDGQQGILEYRGYNINDLSRQPNFEEVTYLLWHGRLPSKTELAAFSKQLRAERAIDAGIKKILKICQQNIDAMDALRTTVSYLAHCDPDLNSSSPEANIRKGIRLAAKFPTIVAAFHRIRNGLKPVAPKSKLSSGMNFLYMLRGELPTEIEAQAMETDFVLTAEHELNASAFATRVTVSTLSDLHSAICSGIGTLKGPLHGGARAAVMAMLAQVGTPDRAEQHIKELIARKEKIMGFGHRVYKTFDPRAKIFEQVAKKLADHAKNPLWHEISVNIEKTVIAEIVQKLGKPIYTNVDFYTGAVYRYLNIPPELATAVFAVGRISGWVAHCLEQYADNRLIRPRAEYVGPRNVPYIPIEQR